MIKESIQEEDIMFVNIHAPNIGAPKYINKILKYIKGEIDNNTIIVGNINTPLNQRTDHPDRTQALVPSTRKPTQPTEPATGDRHQKQWKL